LTSEPIPTETTRNESRPDVFRGIAQDETQEFLDWRRHVREIVERLRAKEEAA